jgi:hypothetical protein
VKADINTIADIRNAEQEEEEMMCRKGWLMKNKTQLALKGNVRGDSDLNTPKVIASKSDLPEIGSATRF